MDRRSRRRPIAEINVVPYIDVMLVLLVIFMITAPLLKTGVEVTLPKADAKPMEQTQSEPLIVTVDGEGRFFINIGEDPESPVGEEQLVTLATAAMRRDGDRRVLVRGDQGVNYQKVVRAMALLQRAGVPQVGLVAEAQ
ncbi:MAG: protein TolR [Halofilum sp. (in: g-proteobacteria)]|jgi:biopolymer transport protein TolR|nr:protein TolR [Halofilum sp. (in: g-proteobacteria)]